MVMQRFSGLKFPYDIVLKLLSLNLTLELEPSFLIT